MAARSRWRPRLKTALMAAGATIITISLVIFPKDAFNAAVAGMRIFFDIVFPSLLPFFILSEILMGLGVVHFLGVLLEPLMRPLFNVPGVGAFALSMGLAAGYPMDAVLTAKFRRSRMCTRVEGERLLAFTNTADPLFMFGAVAVGMFGRPDLGVILAGAHYLSSFAVGMVFRFYGRDSAGPDIPIDGGGHIVIRAVRKMFEARREDGRPFGRLLADAVNESVRTLLMICGFIMLFSVMVRVLSVVGAVRFIDPLTGGLLKLAGFSRSLTPALFQGLLEIDLGTVAASKAMAPLWQRLAVASAVIAWSGLSVHGQVASVINGTDIRMGPYVAARLMHAVLGATFTIGLLALTGGTLPVFSTAGSFLQRVYLARGIHALPLVVERACFSALQIGLFMGALVGISLLVYTLKRIRIVWMRVGRH